MAFNSLASRISNLPLVICGPILREVNQKSVSVWVALQEKRNVGLTVFINEDADELVEQFSGSASTVAIGDHLHIAVVTAIAPEEMLPGQIYYYNLFFEASEPPARNSENLESSGVINFKINYEFEDSLGPDNIESQINVALKLPSFSLPPDNLNELRIVHGSCRKPNAEGLDAMAAIDKIIAADWTRSVDRPHYLFLTGDQIYADDVSPIVLYMLMDANSALLGNKKEKLPQIQIGETKEIKESIEETKRIKDHVTIANGTITWDGTIPPQNNRGCIVKHFARFSEKFKNHLITFGEYCSMYLFVWSQTLWDDIPDYEQIYPDKPKKIRINETNIRIEGDIDSPEFSKYKKEKRRLSDLKKTLPEVRRALANVPVYMIFDDHEVTDDWNMTYNWCEGVFSNKLGRRIIQNGMLAYVLFQAWGNTPRKYKENKDTAQQNSERILIEKIQAWDKEKGYFVADEVEIAGPLGMPTSLAKANLFKTVNNYKIFKTTSDDKIIPWNYKIEGQKFEILVLDGRTKRGYPDPEDPIVKKELKFRHGSMFHEGTFDKQIPAPHSNSVELTLIISPTSIFSIPALDFDEFPLIGGLIAKCKTADDETVDLFDHWKNQSGPFEKLLLHIAKRGQKKDSKIETKNIILTGDVHFSAASKVLYQNNRLAEELDQTPCKGVFVQFVSSSFKKQERKVKLLHYEGYKFRTVAGMSRMKLFIEDYPLLGLGYVLHVAFFILERIYTLLDLIDPFDYFEPKLPEPREYLGWEGPKDFADVSHLKLRPPGLLGITTPENELELENVHRKLPVKPHVVLLKTDASRVFEPKLPAPRWRYRIDYLLAEDEVRAVAQVNFSSIDQPSLSSKNEALKEYLKASKNHLEYARKWGSGKEIVGLNNVSELAFDWKTDEKSATQQTWWHLKRKDEKEREVFFPLTKFKVPLKFEENKLPQLPNQNSDIT